MYENVVYYGFKYTFYYYIWINAYKRKCLTLIPQHYSLTLFISA